MGGERTVDGDLKKKGWLEIDGNRLYVQRKLVFFEDEYCISFPHKRLNRLPCVVTIKEEYTVGKRKDKKKYPDLYVLKEHMLLTIPLREVDKNGKGGIQAGKVDGYFIPVTRLEKYSGQKL